MATININITELEKILGVGKSIGLQDLSELDITLLKTVLQKALADALKAHTESISFTINGTGPVSGKYTFSVDSLLSRLTSQTSSNLINCINISQISYLCELEITYALKDGYTGDANPTKLGFKVAIANPLIINTGSAVNVTTWNYEDTALDYVSLGSSTGYTSIGSDGFISNTDGTGDWSAKFKDTRWSETDQFEISKISFNAKGVNGTLSDYALAFSITVPAEKTGCRYTIESMSVKITPDLSAL